MATCLQVPMVVPSTLRSSSSSSLFDMNSKIGWRNVSRRRLNYRCSSSKIPLCPIDPNDPFIKILGAHFEADPKLKPSPNSQYPPFVDLFQLPAMSPAQGARRRSRKIYGYGIHKTRMPPPDLPSQLLNERIIFLGMPLVDLVTELVLAQFMYLQWVDNTSPIYFYINSTGTARDDGEVVAHEANALGIYDIMNVISNDVETLCIGACTGYACLLLASGKLGRRFMYPHCRIAMKPPNVPPTGLTPTSEALIHAREAQFNRDMLYKLFALNTGHRLDDIKEKLKNPLYMGAKEALEFGVVDKIIWLGQKDTIAGELELTPEQWDKLSRGKSINDPSDP